MRKNARILNPPALQVRLWDKGLQLQQWKREFSGGDYSVGNLSAEGNSFAEDFNFKIIVII